MTRTPKNILIFSDGTGQAGGVRPDQRLSNIYKLYRATRSGPDSPIDPSLQIAFYDAGLGTDDDIGSLPSRTYRYLRKLFSSATGTGISKNIIDCYEAILNEYESGDRIYLFGFSRGAYTVRCVANVLSMCGVPTHRENGDPLPRHHRITRAIATEAVRSVYEHAHRNAGEDTKQQQRIKADRFRKKYLAEIGDGSNVVPYFIGAFDTVASVGMPLQLKNLLFWPILALFLTSVAIITFVYKDNDLAASLTLWTITSIIVGLLLFTLTRVRHIKDYPTPTKSRWHIASINSNSYDLSLDPRVPYARHAIAIDEKRRDFKRVGWGAKSDSSRNHADGPERFVQLWFPGCHSDIGGSYNESESRLSDVSLDWMISEVSSAPHPIFIDKSKLFLFPSAAGLQHCEVEGVLQKYPDWVPQWLRFTWKTAPRAEALGAPMHSSVLDRFKLARVDQADGPHAYRPAVLENDDRFQLFYRTEPAAQDL